MMKKISLNNKLKAYCGIASGVLLSSSISGQIVYHDINPDTVLKTPAAYQPWETHDFDLNGDSKIDISIIAAIVNYTSYSGWGFVANNLNGAIVSSYSSNIKPLKTSNYIGASPGINNNWKSFGSTSSSFGLLAAKNVFTSSYSSFYGLWIGETDKYLGIKILTNSNDTLYGWLRLDLNSNCDSLIVKDYAYNSLPNQGLYAGQTQVSGINQQSNNPAKIYYHSGNLHIQFSSTEKVNLDIYQINGQKVFSDNIEDDLYLKNLSFLSKGVYVVEIRCNNYCQQKKIIIP
jgi:hypothetical protein